MNNSEVNLDFIGNNRVRASLETNIRVLVVTNSYPTEEHPYDAPCIKDQIEALQKLGASIDILHIYRQKGKAAYIQAGFQILRLNFQRRRYDLIHAYYGHSGLIARLQLRYPLVVTFRGSDLLSRRDGIIGKPVAKLADRIIVMSEEMKHVAKRSDASIIPFGVNLDLFYPRPVDKARRELMLASDEKIILFPWEPTRPEKRFDLVEDMIRIVREKHDRVRLIAIYGEPHTIVAKYMCACDAMVLVSDHEGSPMAVREAMACNLPIIAVDAGDVRQIISGVEGCYLCDRDVHDIAAKVELVLSRGQRSDGFEKMKSLNALWAAKQVFDIYSSVFQKR